MWMVIVRTFDSFRDENIYKEIETFLDNKSIITNI